MNFSADELEIIRYLESWGGKSVTMMEICRCASGRKRYLENPHWAKSLMSRLVESGQVAVNERGHYQWVNLSKPPEPGRSPFALSPRKPAALPGKTPGIVGDNYFPSSGEASESEMEGRWVSPQIAAILKQAGKKLGTK